MPWSWADAHFLGSMPVAPSLGNVTYRVPPCRRSSSLAGHEGDLARAALEETARGEAFEGCAERASRHAGVGSNRLEGARCAAAAPSEKFEQQSVRLDEAGC